MAFEQFQGWDDRDVKLSPNYLLAVIGLAPHGQQTVVKLSETLTLTSESQKPRQRVSNTDRKVFANPESLRKKLIIG